MTDQVAGIYRQVAAGQMSKAEALQRLRELQDKPSGSGAAPVSNAREAVAQKLAALYAGLSKIALETIDTLEPLASYGIDSIVIAGMNRELGVHFDGLSKTLFFEHRSLDSLAGFLWQQYAENCRAWLNLSAITTVPATTIADAPATSPATATLPTVATANATTTADATTRTTATATAPTAETASATPPTDTTAWPPIAIIGLSGRYPQAADLDAFWRNLREGRDSIVEVPAERWPLDDFFEPDPDRAIASGRSYAKWGGFLEGFADFDPLFFNISPLEAMGMDPQERLFLQTSWHALEDAGYTRDSLAARCGSRVGVFAGVTRNGFGLLSVEAWHEGSTVFSQPAFSSIPNRVSYALDLRGPSLPVDTMCSSSLTAIHEACAALHRGDCVMALAGGVNLCVHPASYVGLATGKMLSTDGRCRSFGAGGDGYVPGEGVGVVVLKPLAAALADGDRIHGVIRATSVNHGGRTNGFTVPNPLAQAELIAESLRKAGIHPRTISYVEAHGTGTALGDPIEISGLAQAFAPHTQDRGFCALGSAKSNLGHLEAAAGIAGLTKVLLQMRHGELVPSLHAEELNPNIDFDGTPFVVQRSLGPWAQPHLSLDGEARSYPRIASVSSFGAGGANAHLLVEQFEAPAHASTPSASVQPQAIVLSARNEDRLRAMAQALLEVVEGDGDGGVATPAAGLSTWLTHELAAIVGVDSSAIDAHEALIDLGVDVLHRTRWYERVQERLRLSWSLKDFLDQGSVQQLVESLLREHGSVLSAHFPVASVTTGLSLADLAHTLQTGREAMQERLAFVAADLSQVAAGLRCFLGDGEAVELWHGRARRGRSLPAQPDEAQRLAWVRAQEWSHLLPAWVGGHEVAWRQLPGTQGARRIGLPVYPFATERYWIDPQSLRPRPAREVAANPRLHPLAQQRSDVADGVGFRSRFSGEESFFRDHQVGGRRIFPGVAYLEMARAAASLAAGGTVVRGLRNVVWARPVEAGAEGVVVDLRLQSQQEGVWRYEALAADGASHSQGLVSAVAPAACADLDLTQLRARMQHGTVEAATFYEAYAAMGIAYGPAHRGFVQAAIGEGELLAELCLPAAVQVDAHAYVLHPSLLDAAFQATLGLYLLGSRADSAQAMLPFALETLEIHRACGERVWAWIRSKGARGGVEKFDIELCDAQGRLCVRMLGFSSRVLEAPASAPALATPSLMLSTPAWRAAPLAMALPDPALKRRVLLVSIDSQPGWQAAGLGESLEARAAQPEEACVALYAQVFERLKSWLEEKHRETCLWQVAIAGHGVELLLAGLSGLLRSAAQESRKLLGQLLILEGNEDRASLQARLDENAAQPFDALVRYHDGRRETWCLQELLAEATPAPLPWRQDGVYLLNGGAGELGLLFAEEITRRAPGATLVLTGRSALAAGRRARLDALREQGVQYVYEQVDVARREAVEALVARITAEHGRLDGVLHIAGVLRDSYILKKDRASFEQVLAPKLLGTAHLDRATRGLALDFFVMFSSSAAIFGNLGQVDYASANGFMDAYAAYRQAQGGCGRSLSVNWPLWRDGGMGMEAATEEMMLANTGMVAMRTQSGFAAFARALVSGLPQVAVMEGLAERMRQKLLGVPAPAVAAAATAAVAVESKAVAAVSTPPASVAPAGVDLGELVARVSRSLRQLVSELLKLELEQIDIEDDLSDYGFDSITFTSLSNRINKQFGLELIPTIFFEYPDIAGLAAYLAEEHQDALIVSLGMAVPVAGVLHAPPSDALSATPIDRPHDPLHESSSAPALPTPELPMPQAASRTTPAPVPVPVPVPATPESAPRRGVAIVGMSGNFPGADGVDALWQLLEQGVDAISEVPASRWDWRNCLPAGESEAVRARVRWGGFIDGVDRFDPLFFGISPREAELMDPQQRLLLTYAWLAIEDAGYAPQSLAGSDTGLFVGTAVGSYGSLVVQAGRSQDAYNSTSSVASIGPSRVSYFLDLHGPSEPIETACSSSLVAVHRAVQAIESGACESVLAGGINTIATPEAHIAFSKAGMLSVDGRCQTFSAKANGYVRGEGVGVLFLKNLAAAERDGDTIHGVIIGSAENHGGRATSLTAPNPKAQAALLKAAYARAGIDPRQLGYIEAHGTGTELGDPIEVNALKSAFKDLYQRVGADTPAQAHCGLGSIKTNIGHLELAAGVAGIIKVLLQLRHRTLVRSLHGEEVNPYVQLEGSPFYLVQENRPWQAPLDAQGQPQPRRAGVSSFGFGGVNAHVVIEEYPARAPAAAEPGQGPVLVPLSAKNGARLREAAARLADFAAAHADDAAVDLRDLAYTLQVGRDAMEVRLGLIVQGKAELAQRLRAWLDDAASGEVIQGARGKAQKEALAAFTGDEELAGVVENWWHKGKHARLLDVWVKGLEIDWTRLQTGAGRRRISLPGYPFADERYWLKPVVTAAAVAPADRQAEPALFFEESWQQYQPQPQPLAAARPRTLLCCLSQTRHQQALREALAQRCPELQVIFLSRSQAGQDQPLDPRERRGWTAALLAAEQAGATIDALAYLWPLEEAGLRLAEAVPVGLVQALGDMTTRPARLVLGGEYADELERSQLEAWIGLERSLGLALPGCKAATVLRAAGDSVDWAVWAQLLDLSLSEAEPRSLLANEQGLQRLRVQPLELTQAGTPDPQALGRTVLITGGAGGLGLIFARHLAASRGCNLVLVGRSPLDAARRASLQALQAAGSEVLYLSADVADVAAMREVVALARARFGSIDSVIHAAGLQHAVPLADKQADDVRRVLDPKIRGALVLDEVLAAEPLRFVCYFSSSSAVLGDFGSGDYAVANRFLAAYALAREQRRARGECAGRSLAIEWPLWRDGGMGVGDDERTAFYLKTSGQRLLERAAGLAVFERLLAGAPSRVLVLVGERERLHGFLGLATVATVAPVVAAVPAVAPLLLPQGLSLEDSVAAELTALIGHQVKLAPEQLDADASLADFGLDSIGLAELARQLSAVYRIELAPSIFFAYSNIARLAQYFLDKHRGELEAHYRELRSGAVAVVEAEPVVAPAAASGDAQAAASVDTRAAVPIDTQTTVPGGAQAAAPVDTRAATRVDIQATAPIRTQAAVPVDTRATGLIGAQAATPINTPAQSGVQPTRRDANPSPTAREPIAIIGMSGRFPKARDIDEMWRVLVEGIDAVEEIPSERFDWRTYYGGREVQTGKSNSKWGGCIDGVREFDPLFFEISPREALSMDPRQRLLLQESWNALEDAGYGPRQLRAGTVGIFVGVEEGDYQRVAPDLGVTSNHNGILASRLAYFLDLNGPVLAINTACSSALVAVHQACASLSSGECDTAIAAGANLILTPEPYVGMSQAGMLSPDGQCRAFDQTANGMVPGEAVAVVVLKRLSSALADGDPIRGLIRGSGINNDGHSNGITAPNALAQTSLVRQVQRAADVVPAQIDYVVTHGTGTRLGDPVEIQALAEAFGPSPDGEAYCALTSSKSNFGHTFAASGLVSLIGLMQAFEHETIPPSLHCTEESDFIAWRDSAFYVNKTTRPWPRQTLRPRLGAVSSFGMSGTNAHLLVQEAPALAVPVAAAPPSVVLALSAKTEAALRERLLGLRDWLASPAAAACELALISRTLLDGRHHFAHRAAVVVSDRAAAIDALERLAAADGTDGAGYADGPNYPDGPAYYRGKQPRGFKGEEALRQRAASWPAQRLDDPAAYRTRLHELAQLHCQGYAVAWSELDGLQGLPRIHLPGYPFARESYWPKARTQSLAEGPAQSPTAAAAFQVATQASTEVPTQALTQVPAAVAFVQAPAQATTAAAPAQTLAQVPAAAAFARASARATTVAVPARPMLRQDRSDETQGQYTANFSGEEFFLTDHRVRGQSVLPGVAYLELARAALEMQIGRAVQGGLQVQHVTWVQPLLVDAPGIEARIALRRQESGEWRYEISSGEVERRLHGQGFLRLDTFGEPAALDLPGLRRACQSGTLDSVPCYAAYQSVGIEYGPSFRAVQRVWVGEGEALAQLRLPATVQQGSDAYALHPSMLDGALQASIGLAMAQAAQGGSALSLPFALDSLVLYRPCPAETWVWIRPTPGAQSSRVRKLDLDLCDAQGRICVALRGFSSRLVVQPAAAQPATGEAPVESNSSATAPMTGAWLPVGPTVLAPVWTAQLAEPAPALPAPGRLLLVGGEAAQRETWQHACPQLITLNPDPATTVDELRHHLSGIGVIDELVWIAPAQSSMNPGDEALLEAQAGGALALFRLIKALLAEGYASRRLAWTVITRATQQVHPMDEVAPAHATVHGLAGALAKEYPHWPLRLLDLDAQGEDPTPALCRAVPPGVGDSRAWRRGEWYARELLALTEPTRGERPAPYREAGVYVVIGGAGGLGEVWTRHVIEHYRAQVVWIGRRAPDASLQARLTALSSHGPAPVYLQADAGDRLALAQARATIVQRYGRIHGVVHSALVLQDRSLARMDEATLEAALRPKLDVSVRMAQVFAEDALDFVLFFSSMMSFSRAAGQGNYAAGCTFKDALAEALGRHWSCAVKVMNWGYWGSVGVVADARYQERMSRAGIGSIEADEAMAALERLLSGPDAQLGLIKLSRAQSVEGIRADLRGERYGAPVPALLPQLAARALPPAHNERRAAAQAALPPQAMQALSLRLLGQVLRSFSTDGRHLSGRSTGLGLAGHYQRWYDTSLRLLAAGGQLEPLTNGDYRILGAQQDAWPEWEAARAPWLADPQQQAWAQLLEVCLRALPDLLVGRRKATDVMFPNSSLRLVEGIYRGNPIADLYNQILFDAVEAYVQERLARDPQAQLRVLEIGAGTGGTSAGLLQRLDRYAGHIAEYCYTDLSKAFLLHAEQHYAPGRAYLRTQRFNVEEPPQNQGIAVDTYDVVVAANVLHATANIRCTLRHAKAPLRAGGVLVLNELGELSLLTHLSFGLLDGWWLYEDPALRLDGSPGLSAGSWERVLAEEGYAPLWRPAADCNLYGQQVLLAQSDGRVKRTVAVQAPSAAVQPPAGSQPAAAVSAQSAPVFEPVFDAVIEPVFAPAPQDLEQAVADHVRELLRDCIGQGLDLDPATIEADRSFSEYGVDSILAVQLVNEINRRLGIVLQTTVLFDYSHLDALAAHLEQEFQEALRASLPRQAAAPVSAAPVPVPSPSPSSTEPDRRSPMAPAAQIAPVAHATHATHTASAAPIDGTRRRALISGPGQIQDLRLVDAEPTPALQPQQVRIAVRASSLNFSDLLCVMGLYPNMPPYPFTPGTEASGLVLEVGSAVGSLRPGDEVVCLGQGCHASEVICNEAQVWAKPPQLSFEQACALPVVALTMIDAFHKADLQPGESILIQTAAGGTGLIALQLARHYGATIFATAGSQEKLDYLAAQGAHHLINYREQDFEAEVARLTGGRGVDVVINTLSGDAIAKGLRSLAPGGRYIEIAMMALKSAHAIDLSVLNNNQSFFSVDLARLIAERPRKLEQYQRELAVLVEQGVLQPTVAQVFPFEQLHEAYRYLQDRRNIGKVVVQVPQAVEPVQGERVPTASAAQAPNAFDEPIAVIGMSGRFAHSPDLASFWSHLADGHDLVDTVSRWELEPGEGRCRHGSFLDGIDRFDPLFFRMSGLEATYMDPQQRLFLEEAWHTLEDAGYAGEAVKGKLCGVYVGCTGGDYAHLFTSAPPPQAFWGNSGALIPARIAYCLDLQGPAVAVDTACSSSLVAVHLACQGLRAGETELALAGGVFVQSTPGFYMAANPAGMLSATGRCHTFDANADGFVPGEGVGAILLKRLSDAIADGDHIHGVIRGSAINQDGHSNGITAPSARSQERLERQVYDRFGVHPETLQMVEAHGTGTRLGDPIEYHALSKAFGHYTQRPGFCALGSVKTNIGHLANAAGIAGILKILLALRHRQLPPSLHFQRGNPAIAFEGSPFYVNTELRPWPAGERAPRRAAVSSFGFSGTNAHMVIEEAPSAVRVRSGRIGRDLELVALSARTAGQLRQQAENLLAYCQAEAQASLGDIAHTLLTGREHRGHRLAAVVRSAAELQQVLTAWLERGERIGLHLGELDEGGVREQVEQRRLGQAAIDAVRNGQFDRLQTVAELFVQGYKLTYASLFGSGYRRLALPTYPFAQELYWVNDSLQRSPAPMGATTPAPTAVASHGPAAAPVVAVSVAQPQAGVAARAAFASPVSHTSAAVSGKPTAALREASVAYLKQLVATTLRVSPAEISAHEPLERYGIDSILVVQLTDSLRQHFDSVSSTLLFEVQTIDALAERLLATEAPALARQVGLEVVAPAQAVAVAEEHVTAEALAAEPVVAQQPVIAQQPVVVQQPVIARQPVIAEQPVIAQQPAAAQQPVVTQPPAIASTESEQPATRADMAVIGLSGRYPKAADLHEFWQNLRNGRDCIDEVPAGRWDWREYFDAERGQAGHSYSRWGGFIDGVDRFDPRFFRIPPSEAEYIDPQERLFLQIAYQAIEDAGYTPASLSADKRVGVFVAAVNSTYTLLPSHWSIANRVSFALDFNGPSLAVNSACSSSLTALHLAMDSLAHGSSEVALVGGVSLVLHPEHFNRLAAMGMLSSDAHCRPLGEDADGFVDGEGVGALLLKPLQRAVEDGDQIYGVIKGSMLNASGKTRSFVVPNAAAQARLVTEAMARAGVAAETISYLEAHSNGGVLGDLTEMQGLAEAFAGTAGQGHRCAIGSVKSNIGYCECAAGIAGLTKVLLQLRHGELVPTLHAQRANPKIEFAGTPFVLQQELGAWPRSGDHPRRAGVSAFGMGGSYAHVIVEEYIAPVSQEREVPATALPIVVSAANAERLRAVAGRLASFLESATGRELSLADLAYTLQVGRESLSERVGFIAGSVEQVREVLRAYAEEREVPLPLVRASLGTGGDGWASFADDEDFGRTVEQWIAREKYAALLDLWGRGYPLDWRRLHATHRPRRVSLPGYPFAEESYWLPEALRYAGLLEDEDEDNDEGETDDFDATHFEPAQPAGEQS
ncbi:SDR family NAD(P)-dependent oxidoreductase [Paraburkholderia acidicola]|nr:SDR family NAD(P)-dependent oxidoreductase [Paraburkholderia acidicola]